MDKENDSDLNVETERVDDFVADFDCEAEMEGVDDLDRLGVDDVENESEIVSVSEFVFDAETESIELLEIDLDGLLDLDAEAETDNDFEVEEDSEIALEIEVDNEVVSEHKNKTFSFHVMLSNIVRNMFPVGLAHRLHPISTRTSGGNEVRESKARI